MPRRCTRLIRWLSRRRRIFLRSRKTAGSSSSSTATAIRGSHRSTRSDTTSRWPQRTAERTRWPSGAGCSLCQEWLTAEAALLWTTSTCSAHSLGGLRRARRPSRSLPPARRFPDAAVRYAPIPNTRSTPEAETRRTPETSSASEDPQLPREVRVLVCIRFRFGYAWQSFPNAALFARCGLAGKTNNARPY